MQNVNIEACPLFLPQDLFEPPNVGGWPGGRTWISPRTMIGRANYVNALLDGPGVGRQEVFESAAFAAKHGQKADDAGVFCARLLYGVEPNDAWRKRLGAAKGRQAAALLLTSAEGQLG